MSCTSCIHLRRPAQAHHSCIAVRQLSDHEGYNSLDPAVPAHSVLAQMVQRCRRHRRQQSAVDMGHRNPGLRPSQQRCGHERLGLSVEQLAWKSCSESDYLPQLARRSTSRVQELRGCVPQVLQMHKKQAAVATHKDSVGIRVQDHPGRQLWKPQVGCVCLSWYTQRAGLTTRDTFVDDLFSTHTVNSQSWSTGPPDS